MNYRLRDTSLKHWLAADRRKSACCLVWTSHPDEAMTFERRSEAEHLVREWTRTWKGPIPTRYEVVEVQS